MSRSLIGRLTAGAAIAAMAFGVSMGAAHALSETEILDAVQAALPKGVTLTTASQAQLEAAVADVVAKNPSAAADVAWAIVSAVPDKSAAVTASIIKVTTASAGGSCGAGASGPSCCPAVVGVSAAAVAAAPASYSATVAAAEAAAPYCMLQIAEIPNPLDLNPAAGPVTASTPPGGPGGRGGSDS